MSCKNTLRAAFLLLLFVAVNGVAGGAQTDSSTKPVKQTAPHAIQILKIESSEIKLPPAFQMAIYEYALAEVKKTGIFAEVYRDGDRRAADAVDRVVLHTDVRGFKEGSAKERQVTTVAGKTLIKVHMQLMDPAGKVVLEKDIEGKVRFLGENMRATFDLAKGIAHTFKDNFQKPAPAKKS
jgi:hypothetical protein